MFDKEINPRYIYPIIIVVSLIIFGANIWGNSIYILDEAKNSGCAREMYESNEYVVPTFNYELRTDKPPLHYYFMHVGYFAFGVNPLGARFFSVVFGLLTVLITFYYTRKFLGLNTAWWAVVALWSSLHFALEFHLAVPDPYLIFFIALALMSFYDFYKTRNRISWWLLYVAIGFGVLAKGPVAIALPGLVFFIFLIVRRGTQWRLIKQYKPIWGALVVVAIAVPWYYLVGVETDGEWLRGFFLEHNLERFSDTKEGHGGSFLMTPAFILFGMLPFSVFMVQAMFRNRKIFRNDDFASFSFIAAMVFIVFFTVSGTKLPNYPMPAYPFLAIVIAYFILKQANHAIKWPFVVHLVVAVLIPVLVFVAMYVESSLIHLRWYSFGFILLPISGVVALVLQYKKQFFKALKTLVVGWIATILIFFYVVFPAIDRENPVSQTYQTIDINQYEVAYYRKYNPAFSFYLQREIPRMENTDEVHAFLKNPDAVVITVKKRLKDFASLDEFEILVKQKDLFERPTTVVMRKKRAD